MTGQAGTRRIDCSRHIGTEFPDVPLTDLDGGSVSEIVKLAAERCVLVFRDQHVTLDEQIAFGAQLGPLHVHPLYRDSAHPEALRVHTDANSSYVPGQSWHTDVSCDEQPPALSILRMEVVPSCGGDTAFASMYAAYDTLSEPMRSVLLGLRAIHTGDLPYRGLAEATPDRRFPKASHPVVRTHPISGRRALYVNSVFTDAIESLTRSESAALLAMLLAHIAEGVEFQCRVRWEAGTVVIWGNRCVQPHASWDYFPETRSGWRVTTVGEKPLLVT
jgi:taurine dioxygenase